MTSPFLSLLERELAQTKQHCEIESLRKQVDKKQRQQRYDPDNDAATRASCSDIPQHQSQEEQARELRELRKEVTMLKAKVHNLAMTCSSCQQTLASSQSSMPVTPERALQTQDASKPRPAVDTSELDDLRRQIISLTAERNDLQDRVVTLEQIDTDISSSQLQRLQSQVETLELERQTTKAEKIERYSKYKDDIASRDARIAQLECELQNMKTSAAETKRAHDDPSPSVPSTLETSSDKVGATQCTVTDNEPKHHSIPPSPTHHDGEAMEQPPSPQLRELCSQIETLESEREKLEKQVARQKHELDEEIKEKSANIEALVEGLSKLKHACKVKILSIQKESEQRLKVERRSLRKERDLLVTKANKKLELEGLTKGQSSWMDAILSEYATEYRTHKKQLEQVTKERDDWKAKYKGAIESLEAQNNDQTNSQALASSTEQRVE